MATLQGKPRSLHFAGETTVTLWEQQQILEWKNLMTAPSFPRSLCGGNHGHFAGKTTVTLWEYSVSIPLGYR
jgi:hypothetical protein